MWSICPAFALWGLNSSGSLKSCGDNEKRRDDAFLFHQLNHLKRRIQTEGPAGFVPWSAAGES